LSLEIALLVAINVDPQYTFDAISDVIQQSRSDALSVGSELLRRQEPDHAIRVAHIIGQHVKCEYNSARDWLYFVDRVVKDLVDAPATEHNVALLACLFEAVMQSGHRNNSVYSMVEALKGADAERESIVIELLQKNIAPTTMIVILGHSRTRLATTPLIKQLTSSDEQRQIAALVALERVRDVTAYPETAKLLSNQSELVARHAASTMFSLDRTRASSDFIGYFGRALPHLQAGLVRFLGRCYNVEAVPLLSDVLLTSADPKMRREAAKSVGSLRAANAVDPLILALSDQSFEVRGMAAWALGAIGDKSSLLALEALTSDSHPLVAWSASCSIRDLRGRTYRWLGIGRGRR